MTWPTGGVGWKVSEFSTRSLIEDAVKSKRPSTVAELSKLVLAQGVDEADFVDTVKAMATDGTITLRAPDYEISSFSNYLSTVTLSSWLWSIIDVTVLGVIVVAFTPDRFPLNVIRWVYGFLFVFYLPGYSLIQLVFLDSSEISFLERLALQIALSIAAVALIGLLEIQTPWGFSLTSITASLAIFVVIVATAAAMRKYSALSK